MKKLIKILAVVLALCLALGAFAACVERDVTGPGTGDKPPENTKPGDKKYTVTFILWKDAQAQAPAEIYVKTGEAYGALPAIAANFRPRYTFAGWYTAELDGEKVEASTIVSETKDHFLYAHWKGEGVKVIWDPNGGVLKSNLLYTAESGGRLSRQVEYGEHYGGPFPVAEERKGFEFNGWALADGTGVNANTTVATTEEHVIKAKWRLIKDFFDFKDPEDLDSFQGGYPNTGTLTELSRVERGGEMWMCAKVNPNDTTKYLALVTFKNFIPAYSKVTFRIDFEDVTKPGAPVTNGLGAWVLDQSTLNRWDEMKVQGIREQKAYEVVPSTPGPNGYWVGEETVEYITATDTESMQINVWYNRNYGYDPERHEATKKFLTLNPDNMRMYITDISISPPVLDEEGWLKFDYAYMKNKGDFYVGDAATGGSTQAGIVFNDALSRVEITNPSISGYMQVDNWSFPDMITSGAMPNGFTIEYEVSIDYPVALTDSVFAGQQVISAQHMQSLPDGVPGFDWVSAPAITAAQVNGKQKVTLSFEISRPIWNGAAAIQFRLSGNTNVMQGAKVCLYGMRVKPA